MERTVKDSVRSRRIAVLAAPGLDTSAVEAIRKHVEDAGAHVDVIAAMLGAVRGVDGTLLPVDKHTLAASSVMYDAVLVHGGGSAVATLVRQAAAIEFGAEAYRYASHSARSVRQWTCYAKHASRCLPTERAGPTLTALS